MSAKLTRTRREPDEPILDLVCSGLPADNQVLLTEEFAEDFVEQRSLRAVHRSQAFAMHLGSVSQSPAARFQFLVCASWIVWSFVSPNAENAREPPSGPVD